MKKFLPAIFALALVFAGCDKNSNDPETIELARKVVLDGQSFDVTEVGASYNEKNGEYSLTSCVELDGYSTVLMMFFDKDLIGKSVEAAVKSNTNFAFVMNGLLPYKGEVITGGEIYIRNMDGNFSSGFKSGKVTCAKQGDNVSVKIEGTLQMGASFSYQVYFSLNELETY